jgi:excisionase family DNA binding protein
MKEIREMIDGPLLTAADVAELLAVSPKTVLDWHEARTIPSFKVGRAVRFSRQEILDWLDAQRTNVRETLS